MEPVPAPRQRLHLVALLELAEADGAALLPRRAVVRRTRTRADGARPVQRHGQARDRGVVEARRLWETGGGGPGGQRRRGGVPGRRRRPRRGDEAAVVVAVARPSEVEADGDEADEDAEERHEDRRHAAAAHLEVAVVHVAVPPPKRLLRCHACGSRSLSPSGV